MTESKCCNGDGRPVKAPSKVLCAECLAKLSEKMSNLLKDGQHVNEPGVGPMARLKQENRDLEAENARLKGEVNDLNLYINHRWGSE